jgi:dCTP deaminase
MILSGPQISEAVKSGDIVISPFDESQVGPNSYDFRLGDRCKIYRSVELDVRADNPTEDITVSGAGVTIHPKRIYLFNTFETMGSTRYVPIIKGRSSVGRLGLFINVTADLIDVGSINQWTLQLHSVICVRVFPQMLIGQVTFWDVKGDIALYRGKYAHYESPVASLSYKDSQWSSVS